MWLEFKPERILMHFIWENVSVNASGNWGWEFCTGWILLGAGAKLWKDNQQFQEKFPQNFVDQDFGINCYDTMTHYSFSWRSNLKVPPRCFVFVFFLKKMLSDFSIFVKNLTSLRVHENQQRPKSKSIHVDGSTVGTM